MFWIDDKKQDNKELSRLLLISSRHILYIHKFVLEISSAKEEKREENKWRMEYSGIHFGDFVNGQEDQRL